MLFARMIKRDIFIPPPVLPAQAPTNIKITMQARDNSGHRLKSAVAKPVVDIIETTVNDTCFIVSPKLPKNPLVFMAIIAIAEITIATKHLTSLVKASLNFLIRMR